MEFPYHLDNIYEQKTNETLVFASWTTELKVHVYLLKIELPDLPKLHLKQIPKLGTDIFTSLRLYNLYKTST